MTIIGLTHLKTACLILGNYTKFGGRSAKLVVPTLLPRDGDRRYKKPATRKILLVHFKQP